MAGIVTRRLSLAQRSEVDGELRRLRERSFEGNCGVCVLSGSGGYLLCMHAEWDASKAASHEHGPLAGTHSFASSGEFVSSLPGPFAYLAEKDARVHHWKNDSGECMLRVVEFRCRSPGPGLERFGRRLDGLLWRADQAGDVCIVSVVCSEAQTDALVRGDGRGADLSAVLRACGGIIAPHSAGAAPKGMFDDSSEDALQAELPAPTTVWQLVYAAQVRAAVGRSSGDSTPSTVMEPGAVCADTACKNLFCLADLPSLTHVARGPILPAAPLRGARPATHRALPATPLGANLLDLAIPAPPLQLEALGSGARRRRRRRRKGAGEAEGSDGSPASGQDSTTGVQSTSQGTRPSTVGIPGVSTDDVGVGAGDVSVVDEVVGTKRLDEVAPYQEARTSLRQKAGTETPVWDGWDTAVSKEAQRRRLWFRDCAEELAEQPLAALHTQAWVTAFVERGETFLGAHGAAWRGWCPGADAVQTGNPTQQCVSKVAPRWMGGAFQRVGCRAKLVRERTSVWEGATGAPHVDGKALCDVWTAGPTGVEAVAGFPFSDEFRTPSVLHVKPEVSGWNGEGVFLAWLTKRIGLLPQLGYDTLLLDGLWARPDSAGACGLTSGEAGLQPGMGDWAALAELTRAAHALGARVFVAVPLFLLHANALAGASRAVPLLRGAAPAHAQVEALRALLLRAKRVLPFVDGVYVPDAEQVCPEDRPDSRLYRVDCDSQPSSRASSAIWLEPSMGNSYGINSWPVEGVGLMSGAPAGNAAEAVPANPTPRATSEHEDEAELEAMSGSSELSPTTMQTWRDDGAEETQEAWEEGEAGTQLAVRAGQFTLQMLSALVSEASTKYGHRGVAARAPTWATQTVGRGGLGLEWTHQGDAPFAQWLAGRDEDAQVGALRARAGLGAADDWSALLRGRGPQALALFSWESLHSHAVGGVAPHVTELAAALARVGHSVHVFVRSDGAYTVQDHFGVSYHQCPFERSADFVAEMGHMCESFLAHALRTGVPFSVLHVHDWLAAGVAIEYKRRQARDPSLTAQVVATIHSTEFGRCGNNHYGGPSGRIRETEARVCAVADRLICVSDKLRDEVCQLYGVHRAKIQVIHNGIHVGQWTPPHDLDRGASKQALAIEPLDPLFLFVGRLVVQKGIDVLIAAIPSILELNSRARFVIAGEGHMRAELQRACAPVAHAVRFVGKKSAAQLRALYHVCDAVVVPSRNEPFGIVVLEGWAAGKPVVATKSGPATFLTHDHDGLLVDCTPESVAWGCRRILEDFGRARAMGANGLRSAAERFCWDAIGAQTSELYLEQLGLRDAPPLMPGAAPDGALLPRLAGPLLRTHMGIFDDRPAATVYAARALQLHRCFNALAMFSAAGWISPLGADFAGLPLRVDVGAVPHFRTDTPSAYNFKHVDWPRLFDSSCKLKHQQYWVSALLRVLRAARAEAREVGRSPPPARVLWACEARKVIAVSNAGTLLLVNLHVKERFSPGALPSEVRVLTTHAHVTLSSQWPCFGGRAAQHAALDGFLLEPRSAAVLSTQPAQELDCDRFIQNTRSAFPLEIEA